MSAGKAKPPGKAWAGVCFAVDVGDDSSGPPALFEDIDDADEYRRDLAANCGYPKASVREVHYQITTRPKPEVTT